MAQVIVRKLDDTVVALLKRNAARLSPDDVASKCFFPEPGSREAEALLSGTDLLIAPGLIVAEVRRSTRCSWW